MKTIRDVLKNIEADVILLQEIHGHHPKDYINVNPPLEELADTYWPHFRHGVNSVYPSNFHGNAIMSRYPIVEWSNTDISTNKLEKRGFLHSKILYDGKVPIDLFCTHLNLFPTGQFKQWRRIQSLIEELQTSDHVVVAGDFNDWTYMSHKRLGPKFQSVPFYKTYPSHFPILSLDRLYFKGFELVSSSTLKEYKSFSDHLPIFADLQLQTDDRPI